MKLEKWSWIAGIVAAVVAILAWLVDRNAFIAFCEKCGKFLVTLFSIALHWLDHPVTWPVWALILLGVFCLAMPWGVIFAIAYFEKQAPQSQQANPYNYVTDVIFGIEWLWSYVGTKLNEHELSAFCPNQNCKCRLDRQINQNSRNYFGIGLELPVALVCGNCGFRREFDFGMEDLKRKVFVEIERRIRTGEFQQRMTQDKV